ncbi:MAG: M1 family metallopeptidase [Salibacteraceae bacterium]
MNKVFLSLAVISLFVSGCTSSKNNSKYLDKAVELTAIEVFGQSEYKASRTRTIDIIHTDLKVSFDWEQQYMDGEAVITLKPYFYQTDVVVLDAKGMEIREVGMLKLSEKTPLKYSYVEDVLAISLDRNYAKSEQIKIYINYTAKPEERRTTKGTAVTDDKGLYFINPLGNDTRKPQQLWTQGEPEANSVWFPTVDSPNERCTHQISMTVEDRFVTLSNGDLVSSKKDGNGFRTDTWIQNKPIAPYLFMMAVSEYAVVKDSLNGMDVHYYVDKDYEPYAREIFKNTPEMITFYSNLLGYPYPWSKYSQVVAHDYVSGAMENVGAVIFGDFVQQTHREMIDGDNEATVAHELFHHWFGDVVTCESWSNLPLNESFATYGEYLWFEHKYGRMFADHALNYDLNSYLREANSGSVKNTIRFHYNKPDDMFDSHSYAKGGRILHMLRNYVGDEAFFTSLKNYLHNNEFSAVEIHQLRLEFEKTTGEDLNWFFNQWFMGKGHPKLEISYSYDTANAVQNIHVSQVQDVNEWQQFKFPVDIDIYEGGLKKTYSVMVDSLNQTFSFPVKSYPDLVNFDARKILVCEKEDKHTVQEMAFMYHHAPLYMDKYEAVMFAVKAKNKSILLDAMVDDNSDIRELAVSNYVVFDEIEDLKLKDVLISTLKNDSESNVRAEAAIALYDKYSWAEGMMSVFEAQIKADSSYIVIAELIKGIAIGDSVKGMTYANKHSNSQNIDVLFSVAEVYSVYGNENNASFFTELYPRAEGYEVMSFIDLYSEYLFLVDDLKIQNQGVNILSKEASNDLGWYVRYYAVSGLVDLRDYYETLSSSYTKKGMNEEAAGYSELINRVDAILAQLRLKERDQRVFMSR